MTQLYLVFRYSLKFRAGRTYPNIYAIIAILVTATENIARCTNYVHVPARVVIGKLTEIGRVHCVITKTYVDIFASTCLNEFKHNRCSTCIQEVKWPRPHVQHNHCSARIQEVTWLCPHVQTTTRKHSISKLKSLNFVWQLKFELCSLKDH